MLIRWEREKDGERDEEKDGERERNREGDREIERERKGRKGRERAKEVKLSGTSYPSHLLHGGFVWIIIIIISFMSPPVVSPSLYFLFKFLSSNLTWKHGEYSTSSLFLVSTGESVLQALPCFLHVSCTRWMLLVLFSSYLALLILVVATVV